MPRPARARPPARVRARAGRVADAFVANMLFAENVKTFQRGPATTAPALSRVWVRRGGPRGEGVGWVVRKHGRAPPSPRR